MHRTMGCGFLPCASQPTVENKLVERFKIGDSQLINVIKDTFLSGYTISLNLLSNPLHSGHSIMKEPSCLGRQVPYLSCRWPFLPFLFFANRFQARANEAADILCRVLGMQGDLV